MNRNSDGLEESPSIMDAVVVVSVTQAVAAE
jgi:hypothetical protein